MPPRSAIRKAIGRLDNNFATPFGSKFVSLGWKVTGGQRTNIRALKIHLCNKGKLSTREPIPRQIELTQLGLAAEGAIQTDVVEIGSRPSLFDVRGGDQLQAFDGDNGICGMSFVKNGIGYGLTNAHVVRRMENGGTSGPVDWLDPMAGWQADVGTPIMASQLSYDSPNTEDVAVVRFYSLVSVQNYAAGPPPIAVQKMDYIRPFSGFYWYFAGGLINQCHQPEPVDHPALVNVDGRQAVYSNFWSLQLASGGIGPGMSGSLLCRTVGSTNYACGLIFGGVTNQFVWAFSFSPIFNRIWNVLP
jgi:hypothetical protein